MMNNAKENDTPSKVSFKNKNIKLIKVPKFVSNKWLQYNNKDIVGLFEQNDNDISTLYVQKDDDDKVKKLTCNKNNTVNTYILKQSKVSLKPNSRVTNSSTTNSHNKSNESISQSKSKINMNSQMKEYTESSKDMDYVICADVLKNCEHTYSFLPTLDEDYSLVLKERHYNTNVKKNRYTIIETRNEDHIDSTHTLFKYYTSDDNVNNANGKENNIASNSNSNSNINSNSNNKPTKGNKRTFQENDNIFSSSSSKQKAKQAKKMHVFDLDKAKINMFKIFEKEGKKGVPFSIFTKSFNIPSNYIKNILDEIAVKRKRVSDKKSVYFLKDCIS
ncbi:hypothetical protein POVWA2_029280 [Plasmodium ovale wallikeri]|uniref:Transcription initiation factor IIF subunit beta n=1 Tax=Plasmodium ovale wallikeri TaxID=864142 RepID=A0A1A8YW45_PLAOA|nr:hypothetical protein POVWA1_029540 [Plasmodium ovale wallikeri]SBT36263.1 hypothetical protein POVWA2_029280 [Plasmodium ovale wallikeri]